MSSLSDTVNLTKKIFIGFIIFALIATVLQLVITNLPEEENPTGGQQTFYFLPPTANADQYNRLELESISISENSNPEFVKADDFNYTIDSVNVYSLRQPKVSIKSLAISNQLASTFELDQKLSSLEPNQERWGSSNSSIILEYNRRYETVFAQRNLTEAARNPLNPVLTNSEISAFANQIATNFGFLLNDVPIGDIDVEYVTLNEDQTFSNATSASGAHFAKVNLFLALESSTLQSSYRDSNSSNIPPEQISNIAVEDPKNANLTLYFNGDVANLENLVRFEYIPVSTINRNLDGTENNQIPYEFEVYSALEVEKAFEFIKSGEEYSYLAYINKRGSSTFDTNSNYEVRQFLVDASSVRVIYIMNGPREAEEDYKLHPFYLFEGVANLTDNSQADFIFLVDAVAR